VAWVFPGLPSIILAVFRPVAENVIFGAADNARTAVLKGLRDRADAGLGANEEQQEPRLAAARWAAWRAFRLDDAEPAGPILVIGRQSSLCQAAFVRQARSCDW